MNRSPDIGQLIDVIAADPMLRQELADVRSADAFADACATVAEAHSLGVSAAEVRDRLLRHGIAWQLRHITPAGTPEVASERSFAGWVPIHIFPDGPRSEVLWSMLGVSRFDDPFFAQTVTGALSSPLATLLHRHTSLVELIAASERETAVEPAGFVFHVSRCGSTLVSQMFARVPRIISISEAQPLTAVAGDSRLSATDRGSAFRALIRLYGRKTSGNETASLFKFGARELFAWRAIREIYPHVPRVVLHRDPVEVIVSNILQGSETTLPGNLPPGVLCQPPQPVSSAEDYAAFVLWRIYAWAAEAARADGSLTIRYSDLPKAVEALIAPHFGIALDEVERVAMRGVAHLYAKDPDPTVVFTPDSARKQARADASTRAWVSNWFHDSCGELAAWTHPLPSEDLESRVFREASSSS